jgi:hypothetical protein
MVRGDLNEITHEHGFYRHIQFGTKLEEGKFHS